MLKPFCRVSAFLYYRRGILLPDSYNSRREVVSVMHHHEEEALSSEMELQALKERGVEAVNKVSHCLYHYCGQYRNHL